MGVIAKRPLANAVWRYGDKPENAYHLPYWERMQKLAYDFLQDDPAEVAATSLKFTLAVPGVHTAIVGTARPGRWRDNAASLESGALPQARFDAIRARWRQAAEAGWTGQT